MFGKGGKVESFSDLSAFYKMENVMMNKSIKNGVVIFIISMVFFTGCTTQPQEKTAIDDLQTESVQAFNAVFEECSRTYINIYKSEVLYMEMTGGSADFYVYNFATQSKQKVSTVSNFALQGRGNALVGDTAYFYIGIDDGGDVKNVLYAMNYTKKKMYVVSENSYSKKLIPLIEFKNQVLALQENKRDDGDVESFFEVIDDRGKAERVMLRKNGTGNSASQNIINFDGDGQYLYLVEMKSVKEDIHYFIAKYDMDFNFIEETEITKIFAKYNIENVAVFHAFNNYFCITDLSGNSILCKLESGELSALLREGDLEYVVNSCKNPDYEFFYIRRTNEIYRLNVKQGKIEKQNYNLENDTSNIRCVLLYDNTLLITKNSTTNENTESLYFIPYDE